MPLVGNVTTSDAAHPTNTGESHPLPSPRMGSHRGPGSVPSGSQPFTLVMSPNTRGTQAAASSSDQPMVLSDPSAASPGQLVLQPSSPSGADQQIVPSSTALARTEVQRDLANARIAWVECSLCPLPCWDPSRCCQCQRVGHAQCLRLHTLHGYTFCEPCIPIAKRNFLKLQTEAQRQAWKMACNYVREMQLQWRVSLDGAADAAGSVIAGVAVTAVSSTMRFASSIAAEVAAGLPDRTTPAVADAPPPSYSPPDPALLQTPATQPSAAGPPASTESLMTARTHISTPRVRDGVAGADGPPSPAASVHRMASRSSSPAGSTGRAHSLSPTLRHGLPFPQEPQSFYGPRGARKPQSPETSPAASAAPAPAGTQGAAMVSTAAAGDGGAPVAAQAAAPAPPDPPAAVAAPPPPAPLLEQLRVSRTLTGARERERLRAVGVCTTCESGGRAHRPHTRAPGCRLYQPPPAERVDTVVQTDAVDEAPPPLSGGDQFAAEGGAVSVAVQGVGGEAESAEAGGWERPSQ